MYGKCGASESARSVFVCMRKRNVFTWNIMLSIHAQQGELHEALKLFKQMPERDVVSWTSMFSAYAQHGQLEDALDLFRQMPARNVVSWNAMITCYAQQGQPKEALKLFYQMPHRNVVTWNIVLACYARQGLLRDAFQVFQQMPERNSVSWNIMISAYVQHGRVEEASQLFQQLPYKDVVSWNSLIAGYGQRGHLKEAIELVEQMPQPNLFSWNAIIAAYNKDGQLRGAFEFFHRMPERNVVSWTLMILGYAQHGKLMEALQIFQEMPVLNAISWTVMIQAYTQEAHLEEAFQFFHQMKIEDVTPDKVTFINILDVCTRNAALMKGKWIHSCIANSKFQSETSVQTSLINMYSKCGCLKHACYLFNNMPERDAISWTAIISAYAQHGHGKLLPRIVQQMHMEGMMVDEFIVCSILSAYSCAGLIDETFNCFVSMGKDYGTIQTLEQLNCIVVQLGHVDWLEEAEALVTNMPFQPSAKTWISLLGTCRLHLDIERGMRVANHASELDPLTASPYVLLSNAFATFDLSATST